MIICLVKGSTRSFSLYKRPKDEPKRNMTPFIWTRRVQWKMTKMTKCLAQSRDGRLLPAVAMVAAIFVLLLLAPSATAQGPVQEWSDEVVEERRIGDVLRVPRQDDDGVPLA